jgi:hypothetical protein
VRADPPGPGQQRQPGQPAGEAEALQQQIGDDRARRAGDVAGMAAEIDDDILGNFVTEGRWDDIADKIVAKYGGIATRVVSYFTGTDVVQDPTAFERWGALAQRVRDAS